MSNTYNPNYVENKVYAIIGQKAILVNEENKVLLLLRSNKAGGGGRWALVGGALELNEEPRVGIQREISEELQIEVKNPHLFTARHLMDKNDFVVVLGYYARVQNPHITLNWEHDDFKWVEQKDALSMDVTESARFFLEEFEQFEKNSAV